MSNDRWRYQEWADRYAPAAFAQRLGVRIQDDGVDLNREEGRTSTRVQYMDLVQMFSDCADAAIDQHVQRQREKEAYLETERESNDYPIESSYYWARRLRQQINAGPRSIKAIADEFQAAMAAAVDEYVRDHAGQAGEGDTSESVSGSPQEAQGQPHRMPAQSMLIRFINGTEEVIHMHHPMIDGHGWTFRQLYGIPYLVIGHGVPRRQYPLCNIQFIELSPDLL